MAALPFYFGVTLPLLPQRNFSIIDLGVLGGVGLLVVHGLLFPQSRRAAARAGGDCRRRPGRLGAGERACGRAPGRGLLRVAHRLPSTARSSW
ncbi:MAG: hypothetical protein H6644_04550 [Caldilineaceae bacterium]|nr:hypothetical protein [Caldilineaceae bacterium]